MMMRTLIVIGCAITLFFGGVSPAKAAMFSLAGERPANLGFVNGKLAPCPTTPNCVSSQATNDHQIAPLRYEGDAAAAMVKIKAAIESAEGSEIITAADDYIYAEFTSKLLGFVDDVEFAVDNTAGVIQVRSASRLGESDLGVNAKRVAAIRAAL